MTKWEFNGARLSAHCSDKDCILQFQVDGALGYLVAAILNANQGLSHELLESHPNPAP